MLKIKILEFERERKVRRRKEEKKRREKKSRVKCFLRNEEVSFKT